MMSEQAMYVVVAAVMAIVTLQFVVPVMNVSERKRKYYLPVVGIPAMMAVGFGLMSQGLLLPEFGGTTMPAARLVVYEIMFPLMAVYIGLAGGLGRRRTAIVAGSMFLVVFGVVLNWAPDPLTSVGNLLTLVALLVAAYLLLGPYDKVAREQSGELKLLYGKLRNLVLLMWVLYIIVGMSTRSGLGLLDVFSGIFIASYLDLVTTVTFGAIIVRADEAMTQLVDEHSGEPPEEPPGEQPEQTEPAIAGAGD
ncbi:hypothetical protein BRC81_08310 [Halobacteriales archaeon QS_1_68_20]|nr:MAG: hypothetical protein BRC81_08310 [Halobacteriales archaeon QS_1_68_20]